MDKKSSNQDKADKRQDNARQNKARPVIKEGNLPKWEILFVECCETDLVFSFRVGKL